VPLSEKKKGILPEAILCLIFTHRDGPAPIGEAGIQIRTGKKVLFQGDHTTFKNHGTLNKESTKRGHRW